MRKMIAAIIVWSISLSVNALGLGSMTVYSDLSQPMRAEIKLVGAISDELPKLKIRIAPPEVFKQNGVPYASSFEQFTFAIEEKSNGDTVIKVSSKEPLREPVIEFVLDVSWPRGHLRRIYSAIINPPTI